MAPDGGGPDWSLERFREYLRMLALSQLNPRLQPHLDASDAAQQTLAQAIDKRDQFRGRTDAELAAWLPAILVHVLGAALRKFVRGPVQKQSLDAAMDESSARLESFLAANGASPSERLERQERLLALAAALAQLPPEQRQVVEMHHLQNCTIQDVAEQMGRTEPSIAGLLRRGMAALGALHDDSVSGP